MRAEEQRLRRIQWDSAAAVRHHELRDETYWSHGARWRLASTGSQYQCEIIAGAFGALLVHGDVAAVRFASGDAASAWALLLWLADCTDVEYYVTQKACIGSGPETVFEYDWTIARDSMREVAEEWDRTGEESASVVDVLRRAAEHEWTEEELGEFLCRMGAKLCGGRPSALAELRFGRVLRSNVVFAHAALNKCAWLLREKYGPEGPPDCRI